MAEHTTSGVRIFPTHEGPGAAKAAPVTVVEPEARRAPTPLSDFTPKATAPATGPATPEPTAAPARKPTAAPAKSASVSASGPHNPDGSTPPVALRPSHQGEVPTTGRA